MFNLQFAIWLSALVLLFAASALLAGPMDTGAQLYLRGQYASAITAYKQALEYDINENSRAHCWFMLGQSYLALGQTASACDAFGNIIERYAGTDWLADAYLGFGDACYRERKFETAIANYKKSMTATFLVRNGSCVYYRLARAYRALGQTAQADAYEAIVRRNYPDSLEARCTMRGKSSSIPSAPQRPAIAVRYAVQIGYSAGQELALAMAAQYKKKGYDAYVDAETRSGGVHYRILVGRYQSKEAALAKMRVVRAKERIAAVVVSTE